MPPASSNVPYGHKIVWCGSRARFITAILRCGALKYCQMLWMKVVRPFGVTRAAEGVAVDEVCDECVAVETTPVPFGLGCEFETWPGR